MNLRVGVIGTGVMGRDHVRRLTEVVADASVTLVADADERVARMVAADYGCRMVADPTQLVASRDVDAVLVASNDASHVAWTRAAIAAGKPVLCEKPLAPDSAGALQVVADEQAAGRRLVQVGFMRRYDEGYRQLKNVIDSGELGAVLLVHCAHRNKAHAPNHTSDMTISNSGIHEIDVVRWLTGSEYTDGRVFGVRRNSEVSAGLADPQFFVLTTNSQVVCDVEVNQNSGYGYDIRCEVVCERGTISLATPHATWVRAEGRSGHPVDEHWTRRFEDAYDRELRDWVRYAAAGSAGGASAWDGYAAAAMAEYLVRGSAPRFELAARPALYDETACDDQWEARA